MLDFPSCLSFSAYQRHQILVGNGSGNVGGDKLENTLLGLEGMCGVVPRLTFTARSELSCTKSLDLRDGSVVTALCASGVPKNVVSGWLSCSSLYSQYCG